MYTNLRLFLYDTRSQKNHDVINDYHLNTSVFKSNDLVLPLEVKVLGIVLEKRTNTARKVFNR